MRTGLEASTETPGMTAPEESLTVPTIEAWAWAMAGMTTTATRTRIAFTNLSASFCIEPPEIVSLPHADGKGVTDLFYFLNFLAKYLRQPITSLRIPKGLLTI